MSINNLNRLNNKLTDVLVAEKQIECNKKVIYNFSRHI